MLKQRRDDFQLGALEEVMPARTQARRHTPGREHRTVPCCAVPCCATSGLPCGGGMSGQDRVYHVVTTNPHLLTLGAVSSRFSLL